MAADLQRLPVLCPVGAQRPAAVSGVALRGGRHGQLVRQDGVSGVPPFTKPAFVERRFKCDRRTCRDHNCPICPARA